MKLYQVTQFLEVGGSTREWSYFGSRAEAKKACNGLIRRSFARWKEDYGIDRMADMPESETIEIAEVITCPDIPTKAMFIRMLNYEGGYFASQRVIEQWNPQDKWHKPGESDNELSQRSEAHCQESA